jgi:nucleoside-diphosphate-sugar epimerase
LHISSIATLSVDPREPVVTEANESKRGTLSAYGKSKLDAELVAWRYHEEGLPLAVFHPSVILGPSAWPDGSSLFPKTIAKGLPVVSPGATGWVDVRDVAEAVVKALDQPPVGERFILNGANASFKSVFSQLANGLGVPAPKRTAPKALLELAWRAERLRERLFGSRPLLTKDSVRAACNSVAYSGEKAVNQGYSTRPIEETTAWVAKMHRQLHG